MADPVFYDSAEHVDDIPSGADATLYDDGLYAVPGDQRAAVERRLGRVRWITIGGNYEAAGAVDYEPGNPAFDTPGLLFTYAKGRLDGGHRARVYTNRANARSAWLDLVPLQANPLLEWWIATLDGQLRTAAELAAELSHDWGAPIPPEQIWAQQVTGRGNRYDISRRFLPW